MTPSHLERVPDPIILSATLLTLFTIPRAQVGWEVQGLWTGAANEGRHADLSCVTSSNQLVPVPLVIHSNSAGQAEADQAKDSPELVHKKLLASGDQHGIVRLMRCPALGKVMRIYL